MPPKKKLTKKEKARMEAEHAELLRIEMEKERQKKLEEERERKQKAREEAEKRMEQEIIENKIRRQQLKKSVIYINEIESQINKIKLEEKQQKEWEHYMRCNGLPNARDPGDLRKYIHMCNTFLTQHSLEERNWLLKANERSLLTQDCDVANLSRDFLRHQQGTLGDMYAQRIKEILGILTEMDDALSDKNDSLSIYNDLLQLKQEIRKFLINFIDDFTYKILSHVDRDMQSDKPGIAQHTYESDVFKTQFWAILGDTQLNQKEKSRDEPRHTEVDFPFLELQLSLPPTVQISNSSIRGLWLNYDHFSDNSPSYKMPNVRLGHLNILQQTKKEWKKRKEILSATLEEATKETPEAMFDPLEQPPEPASVDVDKIYAEYENNERKARRKAMGPDALKLKEFDVNLRRYRIISGVYRIDYLEYPQQDKRLDAKSFIRTIVSPNKLTSKGFCQTYKPPPAPLPGVRRLPEEIEAEMKMIETNLDKLAMVTLQLPNTVLWFEPPIVCRWETAEEALESENDGKLNEEKLTKINITSKRKQSCKNIELPIKEVTDFDLANIPNEIDLYALFVDFVVPRLPQGYCIRIEYTKVERTKTYFHYFTKTNYTNNEPAQVITKIKRPASPIDKNLIRTDSPTTFNPLINFNKILKIKHAPPARRRSSCVNVDAIQSGDGDEASKTSSYMFSELVEDLDELCESQMPKFDKLVEKINSNLSTPRSDDVPEEPEPPPPRRFSGIVIMRDTDIQSDDGQNEDGDEEEESESEYEDDEEENDETDDDDDEDEYCSRWSFRDVHDTKFNDDKLSIQFRTGRLGYFGFAANRYSNMPYQTWEIKPDFKIPGSVLFSLTAAVISIEITITNAGYCINSFQGGQVDVINQLIGRTISMAELKHTLTNTAVDIFPEKDAFCYTEGSCEKNFVMENHLYNCMSTLGLSHNFSWSRWNLLSGSRSAVLLMRELVEGKKVPNHQTLLVTPLKTAVVDCTEVSASFNTIGVPGMEFYADLYHLALVHALPSSKEKQKTMDPLFRDNVAQILMATRPLSFC